MLMCEQCLLLKPDKGMREQQLSVRCPLCKEVGPASPMLPLRTAQNLARLLTLSTLCF